MSGGATYSVIRAAEEFVLSIEDEENTVQAVRGRALELRAIAGEASLKLSERASDSADAVLTAATLLRELNGCLHQVRNDMKESKHQLKLLAEEIGSFAAESNGSRSEVKSKVTTKQSEQPVPSENLASSLPQGNHLESFRSNTIECERALAVMATSSSEWNICLARASEELFDMLDATAKMSAESNWVGKFPEWSAKRVQYFFQRHFLSLTLSSSWLVLESVKGEELSLEQWSRLGEGMKITLEALRRYGYLFMRESEATIQKLVATLLNRAKEDLGTYPQPLNVTEESHPLRKALVRILPIILSHPLASETVAPIVLIRFSMFLQGVDDSHRNDIQLSLNNLLLDARICLMD